MKTATITQPASGILWLRGCARLMNMAWLPLVAGILPLTAVAAATPPASGDPEAIRAFHYHAPEAALADLRQRLAATRWPDQEMVADQSQGVPLAKLQALVHYWGTDYDWRKAEATLNALPEFVTTIDGLDIQFIHVRSKNPQALPLIITHGWPGSILEMVKIIGPLTDPVAYGGRAEDAFDVVIPSLPGYGFSGKPTGTGWDPDHIARAWDVLMKRLGYKTYVAQGGDWGSVVADAMGRQQPAGLLGIHVNMPPTVPAEAAKALQAGGPAPLGLSDQEQAAFNALDHFYKKNCGYAAMMVTRPQTLGYGLADSPAGLAAFFYDKFAQWTDSGGEPERSLTTDEMLDDITLTWLTGTATSGARLYWENNNNNFNAVDQKTAEIKIPVAVTVFPGEIYQAPRSWTERAYPSLGYFHEVNKGGHFAAWEEPRLFAEELRAAFKAQRGARSAGLDSAIRPFHIHVPEAALVELRQRIAATRWPEKETVTDQSQGVQLATMKELARYWSTDYDWRKCEARLNALPEFITEIDGVDIHFIQVRSQHKNALPLIITHGWPGSIIEQSKIIGPLTDPTAYGGRAEDAFDVVIPSMPGYGFSGKPATTGWDPARIAKAWIVLMKRLGYTQFVAQGGDWGDAVSEQMALQAPPELLGIHVNMPATVPAGVARALQYNEPPPANLSAEERHAYDQLDFFYQHGLGYAIEMKNRPQTLYGIMDSPIGLAGWILDHDASSYALIARVFAGQPGGLTRDDVLDNITLYWLTGTAISSARLYWENNLAFFEPKHVEIPVAVSVFPDEIYAAPRTWTQQAYPKLIYYHKLDQGGHFAAWEEPDLFAREIRAAFAPLRPDLTAKN